METYDSLTTTNIVLPAITLEVGKRYIDGRGLVRGPVALSGLPHSAWEYGCIDEHGCNYFDTSGRSRAKSEFSLVAEWEVDLPAVTLNETIDQMRQLGGSFVYQLATLCRVADPANLQALRAAFPSIFAQYELKAAKAKLTRKESV